MESFVVKTDSSTSDTDSTLDTVSALSINQLVYFSNWLVLHTNCYVDFSSIYWLLWFDSTPTQRSSFLIAQLICSRPSSSVRYSWICFCIVSNVTCFSAVSIYIKTVLCCSSASYLYSSFYCYSTSSIPCFHSIPNCFSTACRNVIIRQLCILLSQLSSNK